MKRLTSKQVLEMHADLISVTGGTDGLRDIGLLESALNSPFQTFDEIDMYPTLQQKAARLAFSIVKNHPFLDGNKRSGVHVMLVFLTVNGIFLKYTQEELIEIGLKLADGSIDDKFLFQWLLSKTAIHQLRPQA